MQYKCDCVNVAITNNKHIDHSPLLGKAKNVVCFPLWQIRLPVESSLRGHYVTQS